MEVVSQCHEATLSQKMFIKENSKTRPLTHDEFEKLRGIEQSKRNYLWVPGVHFRMFCDDCGERAEMKVVSKSADNMWPEQGVDPKNIKPRKEKKMKQPGSLTLGP